MMNYRRPLLFLSAFLLGAFLPTFCFAAEGQDRVLSFAFQNSLEHTQGQGVLRFAELVKEKSGGRMVVETFPDGKLGGDLKTVAALQRGKIDLTVTNSGLLSGLVKGFGIFDFPFIFSSVDEADAIVDGSFGQNLLKQLPDLGLIGLGYWELGFRNVTNNIRPINSLEDFKGIKLRILKSPVILDSFNALGCKTVPIAWPQVYQALESGYVDGQENPVTNIQFANLYKVQKYLSFSRHVYSPQTVLVSKLTWKKLSNQEKDIIITAEKEARAYQRKVNRAQMDASLNFLKRQMSINHIPAKEMRKIRKQIKPVIDKYSQEVGVETVKAFNKEIDRIRHGH